MRANHKNSKKKKSLQGTAKLEPVEIVFAWKRGYTSKSRAAQKCVLWNAEGRRSAVQGV